MRFTAPVGCERGTAEDCIVMRIAIVNVGSIVSGELDQPLLAGDTILAEGDRIVSVGTAPAQAVEACDVVIDAGGRPPFPD